MKWNSKHKRRMIFKEHRCMMWTSFPPLAIHISDRMRESVNVVPRPLTSLPYGVRPHMGIRPPILPCSKVVALTSVPSERPDPGKVIAKGTVWATIVEVGMARPPWPSLSVMHVVFFVRADGDMDIWAFARKYVLHPPPFRSVLSILWPNEMVVGFFHSTSSKSILFPSFPSVVFGGSTPPREVLLEEQRRSCHKSFFRGQGQSGV